MKSSSLDQSDSAQEWKAKPIITNAQYLTLIGNISVKTSPNNSKMLEKKRRNEEILKNFQAKNNLMSQDKMLNELTQKHTSNFIFKPEKDFIKISKK